MSETDPTDKPASAGAPQRSATPAPGASRRAFLRGDWLRRPASPTPPVGASLPRAEAKPSATSPPSSTPPSSTPPPSSSTPPLPQGPPPFTPPPGMSRVAAEAVARAESARDAPAAARHLPLIRPPGAVDEATFLARCTARRTDPRGLGPLAAGRGAGRGVGLRDPATRGLLRALLGAQGATAPACSACVDACPVGAIHPASARARTAAGTPVLTPGRVPCTGCPDEDVPPCIAACPTGALHPKGSPRIGTAHVFADGCLAHRGQACRTCHDTCPVPGAIVVRAGRPEVQPRSCVGCGQCVAACPASGHALAVMPLRARPTPASPDSV